MPSPSQAISTPAPGPARGSLRTRPGWGWGPTSGRSELLAVDCTGPAGAQRKRPNSGCYAAGGLGGPAPRTSEMLPPAGAIAQRLLPSGGGAGAAEAPRREAGRGCLAGALRLGVCRSWEHPSLSCLQNTARKPHAFALWCCYGFPEQNGFPRQAVRYSGRRLVFGTGTPELGGMQRSPSLTEPHLGG